MLTKRLCQGSEDDAIVAGDGTPSADGARGRGGILRLACTRHRHLDSVASDMGRRVLLGGPFPLALTVLGKLDITFQKRVDMNHMFNSRIYVLTSRSK